jgi:hypothetical protein
MIRPYGSGLASLSRTCLAVTVSSMCSPRFTNISLVMTTTSTPIPNGRSISSIRICLTVVDDCFCN